MPRWRQYWVLTKPRVTQLAVFCAIIGMFLATPGMVPWPILIGGSIGIWLLAGAAFAVNCLIEQAVDAKMRRTAWRPSATGEITPIQIIIFSCVLGAAGMVTLWLYTNPSGSVKDRSARYIIEQAERAGIIKPGDTLIQMMRP